MRVWAAAALLLVLTACRAPWVACTDIGSVSGVSVTVLAPYAERVDRLDLEVCWTGPCSAGPVALSPGHDPVDQGCTGPDPDDVCSASAVPDGTLVGFLEVPGLPGAEVRVAGSVRIDGAVVGLAQVTRVATTTFPNGPQCGAGGNQLAIEIDRSGIR